MNERMRFDPAAATGAGKLDADDLISAEEVPVISLPIWTPWILVNVDRGGETFQVGKAIKLGGGMTKQAAWEVARAELDGRPDAVAMAVRRDGERF